MRFYHDEGQKTPLDNRGLAVNNMTPSMGRAEYHYKAQAENPNSIHGTEHQTSVNNVGISTSIGGGILWGTAQSMRHQRIRHASPVRTDLPEPLHLRDLTLSSPPRSIYEINIPVGLPEGATQGAVVLQAHVKGNTGGIYDVEVNGRAQRVAVTQPPAAKNLYVLELRVPLSTDAPHAFIRLETERNPILSLAWEEAAPAAAEAAVKP